MNKLMMVVLLFIFALPASCGYRVATIKPMPGNVKTVHVSMFKNKTMEVGAEHGFTAALIQEISRNTDVKIVNPEKADAVINGVIRSVTIGTLTRSSDDSAVERRIYASVDARMTDRSGNVLWSVQGLSEKEEYTVSQQNLTDEEAEKKGIEAIAARMAERLVYSMTDAF